MNRRTILKGLAAIVPSLAALAYPRPKKAAEFEVPEGWKLCDLVGEEADRAYDSWHNPCVLVSSKPLDDEALEVLRNENRSFGMLYGADGPPTVELPTPFDVEFVPSSIRPILVEWEPPRESVSFTTDDGLVGGIDWARRVKRFVFLKKLEEEPVLFGNWADTLLGCWGPLDVGSGS